MSLLLRKPNSKLTDLFFRLQKTSSTGKEKLNRWELIAQVEKFETDQHHDGIQNNFKIGKSLK